MKRAGIDPGAAGQLKWIAEAFDDIRAKGIEVVLFLLELHQPSWMPFPSPRPSQAKWKPIASNG